MPFRKTTCRDYSKYNHIPVYTETNVNIALDYMEQVLTTINNRYIPKITKRVKKGRKCPWLSYEIKT